MMIDLPHVQPRKNHYRYRRKVPQELRAAIGKTEIILPLGKTEAEVVKRWPAVHSEAERQLTAARKGQSVTLQRQPQPAMTPMEQYRWAARHVVQLGLDPEWRGPESDLDPESIARDVIGDAIVARYPLDEDGHPVGVGTKDAALLRALWSPQVKPEPTLEDAERLYLKEKVRGTPDEKKKEQRVSRVLGHVRTALGRKTIILAKVTKLDAIEVRDHMLANVNTTATVKRYLNDLRAIFGFAIDHFELTLTVSNPFTKLSVKTTTVAKDDRNPYSPEQLKRTRARVLCHANEDLRLIWRLLEGTGCRLAEIAGLLASDVKLNHKTPYLDITPHPHRRLKTNGSKRWVPLLGDALDAAKEAVKRAGAGPFLFAAYHDRKGADAASAALMKHVRLEVSDRKVTVHSLRHNMTDRIRLSGATTAEEYLILGRSTGAVGEGYGGDPVRLEVAARALRKALELSVRV